MTVILLAAIAFAFVTTMMLRAESDRRKDARAEPLLATALIDERPPRRRDD
jgi:hypothetical protein